MQSLRGDECAKSLGRWSGKRAMCIADHRTHDRVAAICRIEGRSIGDMMRSAGVREGGNGR